MTGPFVRLTWRYERNREVLHRDDHVWVNLAHVQTIMRRFTPSGEPYTAVLLIDHDSPLEVKEAPEDIVRRVAAGVPEGRDALMDQGTVHIGPGAWAQ